MIVQEPVQAAIWHCLNHYDYQDALFLSERLYAEVKNDDSLFLLATVYHRSGRTAFAYDLLKDKIGSSAQCQYLFGLCAFNLEKFAEAESAITDNDDLTTKSLDDIAKEFGDQAAFVLLLLGNIAAKTERKTRAIEVWKKALKINPFLFSAFENLCKIGAQPNPTVAFQLSNVENLSACHGHSISNVESVIITTAATPNDAVKNKHDLFITPQQILSDFNPNLNKNQRSAATPEESPLANPLCMSGLLPLPPTRHKNLRLHRDVNVSSPQPLFGQLFDTGEYNGTPNMPPPTLTETYNHHLLGKRARAPHSEQALIAARNNKDPSILQNCKPVFSQSSNVPASRMLSSPLSVQTAQNVRRSSRLFSNSYSVKENNKSPTRTKFATPKSPSRKTKQRAAKNKTNEINARNNTKNLEGAKSETMTSYETRSAEKSDCLQQVIALQRQSAEGLMALLRDIGRAYLELSMYNCREAIEKFSALPAHQLNTAWVYNLLGLAHFEQNDYEASIRYFETVHAQEPRRLEHMDVYSTALWHLQREVALSALAQDLVAVDKNDPVTWCVNGNCFSLHKEHDTAIRFFQRAVQVDPTFSYAYTLLGHEYIATEELDKAMGCFRNAVRLNPRHYNAWFGIGTIYSKQERYNLAELNYTKALSINPRSAVILCHIGIVQHALKQTERALATFDKAIEANPRSPLCKFHRGSIYFALGMHVEALQELEELKEIVPKESSVYYLIGKVHKKLGNTDLALQHFSWATDLDPKGASSQIKEAFDPSASANASEIAESPSSPAPDDYPSEGNAQQQQQQQDDALSFEALPDDGEDNSFEQ
ncbi:cell division cycle protein 27 homolog [Cylas formicarius]|uniref:cell division cycle protein 27 homolog n=1 Tax=Cylas formicarius TaxID=197179 RepID=UPI002958CB6E|nr:cell division cycle protein 27 homolog [Cylas formicarius]